MKRFLQINPNFKATTSQKIASALSGLSNTVYDFSEQYIDSDYLRIFNRVNGVWNSTPSTAAIGFGSWTFVPKGEGTIARNSNTKAHSYYDTVSINEWTMLAVVARNTDNSTTLLIEPTASDIVTGVLTLNLMISSANYVALGQERGPSTVKRIQADLPNPSAVHLITLTFSVEQGLKLYIDGNLAAENKTDNRPLGTNQYRIAATSTMGFGHLIVAEVDMSKTQYQANLKSLHDTLIKHYAL